MRRDRLYGTRPVRAYPIHLRLRPRRTLICCLCKHDIKVGEQYHDAYKRHAHVICPAEEECTQESL